MKKIVLSLLICLTMLVAFLPTALTASPIDTEAETSLELHYGSGDTPFMGLDISIYRIAELHSDGTYTLTDSFGEYPVNIYGITSQTEWDEAASTLSAYIAADGISPTAAQSTDAKGNVRFDALETGMYLVSSAKAEAEEGIYTFECFIICLPDISDAEPVYNISAYPKCESFVPSPEKIEYKVIKQWKDTGASSVRPSSVKVDILKDGEVQSTQTLSSDNNWSYSWTAQDDGSIWQAVERDIPKGYTVTVTAMSKTIIVTNTHKDHTETRPQTGDTSNILPYALIMGAAGIGIMLIAIRRRRREA